VLCRPRVGTKRDRSPAGPNLAAMWVGTKRDRSPAGPNPAASGFFQQRCRRRVFFQQQRRVLGLGQRRVFFQQQRRVLGLGQRRVLGLDRSS
jgi:hypothetical protein